MSTRSYICIEQEDGSIKGIYCHFDGYLEYNGEMLTTHYSDREKVEKLISLGDMSSLQKNIEPNPEFPHSFENENCQKDVCIFYGRDRGDTDTEARNITFESAKDSWCEYMYVFGRDNEWYYTELYEDEPHWRLVKQDLDRLSHQFKTDDDCAESVGIFNKEK